MGKYRPLQILSVLSNLITIGMFSFSMANWTWNNILCNPYLRIVLLSILLTFLIFIVQPLLTRWKVFNKLARDIIQLIVIIICVFVIFKLPKGNCAVNDPNRKTVITDLKTQYDTASKDSAKTKYLQLIIDTPTAVVKPHHSNHNVSIKQKNESGDNNAAGRDNNGVQGGKNNKNHIVQGDNSGINGDVTFSNERRLQESDKPGIDEWIKKIQKENNISSKCIKVLTEKGTHAGKFIADLVIYLKSEGYEITEALAIPYESVSGIGFKADGDCVSIHIGTL